MARKREDEPESAEDRGDVEAGEEPEALAEAEADEELVDEAVAFIQDAIRKTVERGLFEIGEFLLQKFFDGDPEQVRSRVAGKAVSFRALLERCETLELPLRRSALHNAVSVAAMQHKLGAGQTAFRQLPHSHQVALLPVRDPKRVEKLASKALKGKLPVRALRQEVAEERAAASEGEAKRGRPPDPVVVKALNRALAHFKVDGRVRAFTKAQVDELDEGQRAAALKVAQQLVAQLEGLIGKLE